MKKPPDRELCRSCGARTAWCGYAMGTWILLLSLWLTAGCGDKAEGTKTHAPLPPGPPTVSKEGEHVEG